VFFSRFSRSLKGFAALIIAAGVIVFFVCRIIVDSLIKAVERYLDGVCGGQNPEAAGIAGDILNDVESRLVPAVTGTILLTTILLILVGGYLFYLKNRIRKSQNTLKSAVDAANIITITLDRSGTILDFNKHAQQLFQDIGTERPDSFISLLSLKDAEKLNKRMDRRAATELNPHFELRLKAGEGYRHLYCSVEPAGHEIGRESYELIAVDITDRAQKEIQLKESHAELRSVYEKLVASEDTLKAQLDELTRQKLKLQESEARYELVIDAAQIGILDWDAVEKKARYSDKWYEIFGFDKGDPTVDLDTWRSYVPPEEAEELHRMMEKHFEQKTSYMECEFRYNKKGLKWIRAVGKSLWDQDGNLIRVAWAYTDITAKKETEEKINKLAYTDLLTGLPNKINLAERFTRELENRHMSMALLLIDLDDFKLVNETYGHLTGDRILIEVAERLRQIIGENMFLARLGGDEFAILIWDFDSEHSLAHLAQEIEEKVDGFIGINDANISLSTSIGITRFPQDAQSFDGLFKNAEMAMYKAKDKKCKYMFYHRELNDAVVERLILINCLKGALEGDEFIVHYQPQFDTRSKRIVALEALLRWENRYLGRVPPSRFIPVAEETGLIIPIGEFVLRSALAFLKKLRERGHDQLIMSVNISIIQLMQKDFTGLVLDLLQEYRIPSCFLELEITESIMLESVAAAQENILLLREAGVKIALDDFGTGYSSLNYLMHLPINTIKIDKSFIDHIGQARESGLLVSAIMTIGRKLGLTTVAEGVEFQEQMDYLMRRKCDRVQGFLLSRPLPESDVEMLLEQKKASGEKSGEYVC